MISLNWCKDYVDIENENLHDLAVKITKAGVNVEKVIDKHIDNIVIGKVIDCEDIEGTHLHLCNVDVGSKTLQIVCGAHNVRKGIKVIVALPGCVLPGNVEIKVGKIRGYESNGMICALFELGVEEKTEENYAKGIAELDTDLNPGEDANIYLGNTDTIYELDVHKHRNNDCYYHIGFAYEIASILSKKVKLPDLTFNEIDENIEYYMNIKVDTDKCPFYVAKMVKNVVIKETPDFIKNRLISAGMRSINNVVDISNYVMLEYGQPLHFFDKKKLGNKIVVRNANENEEIVTLDGQKQILNTKDIVITDGNNPVCIAGVMGGENTEVDENTTDILIESAIFDAVSIRNTAQRLDLRSEASIRYGKGLNYEYTIDAINRACHLLQKYADATILSGMIKHDKLNKENKIVKFKTSEVSTLLGLSLTDKDVETELDRLMFSYELNKDTFVVTIPNRRLDIDPNVNDIAEEIGRLYGYQNLVSTLPNVPIRRGEYVGDVKLRKEISKRLRTLGLNETKTYTLVSPDMAKLFDYNNVDKCVLPNPMSIDKSVIRTSILPSLLNVYSYNSSRKVKDILLYEIAKTYDSNYNEDTKVALLMTGNYLSNSWKEKNKIDFYLIKGIVENLFDYLGFKNRYSFEVCNIKELHPGMSAKILLDREEVGIIGRVHPSIEKEDIFVCEFSMTKLYQKQIKPLKYKEANRYPSIEKDLAFVVDKSVTNDKLIEIIKHSGGRLLTNIQLFDIYTGDNLNSNEKSMAYNLKFEDSSRTLTDEGVMEVFNRIISEVENKIGAKIRNGE